MLTGYDVERIASAVARRLGYRAAPQGTIAPQALSSGVTFRLASAISAKLTGRTAQSSQGFQPVYSSEGTRRLASAVSYKLHKHSPAGREFNELASNVAKMIYTGRKEQEIPVADTKGKG